MTPAPTSAPSPKTLLAIRLSALGDTVQAIQVLQTVAAQWPQTRITLITGTPIVPIARACPFIAEVIPFQKKDGTRAFFSLAKQLLFRRFDMVWDMHGLLRAALITAFPRSKQKWGINRQRGLHGLTYTRKLQLPVPFGQIHTVAFYQSFLQAANLDSSIHFPLNINPPAPPPTLTPFLQDIPANRTFLLFTDSSRLNKNWPHFNRLTQLLLQQIPDSRIIWGGAASLQPAFDFPHDRFLNLTGKTTIPEMLSLVATPSIFIGNDSGPLHIAAALQHPTVALFGPSNPERFGPWPLNAPNLRILRAPNKNLADLPPETVLDSIQSLLPQ